MNDSNDCREECRQFHVMCFVQYKKCERESLVASEQKNDNYEDADNEDNDSSVE